MKGIDSTVAPLVHVPGWMDGWMEVNAVLRIAYSNQKIIHTCHLFECPTLKTLLQLNLNSICETFFTVNYLDKFSYRMVHFRLNRI
jgi:hypothetical protein